MALPTDQRHRFLFISSNDVAWGGSEELWSASAAALAEDGHEVSVFKRRVIEGEPRIQRLRELGCPVHDLNRFPLVPAFAHWLFLRISIRLVTLLQLMRLRLTLRSQRPDLVVVSQGGNFDGQMFAAVCHAMNVPYVLIAQKAADTYWATDARLPQLREVYAAARAAFFVSEHNLRLTEEQLGRSLPRASVVRNPFLVPWAPRQDWPDQSHGLRLACIGRLYTAEKGQDILLRVLARPKWRERKVSLSFYGSGVNRHGLEAMAAHLGLTNVTFSGFVSDVTSIWDDHHALVLPSRCEGLPLVLVEAMLSGRVAIVTDVAGNAEVVEDGVSGFLAKAPTEDAFDEAMERAWQRRGEWRAIGRAAAASIRTMVPPDPARSLAEELLYLAGQTASAIADAEPLDDAAEAPAA
jgi:glycosyltransferase involved in cell wall biosynthesis